MINENVSLLTALLYALPQIVSLRVWVASLVLAMWGLARLRRPASMILSATLLAALASVLYGFLPVVGWLASPALVLGGFACFRRPGAITTIVCAATWVLATWTHRGWEVVHGKTGACMFPGALVMHEHGMLKDEVSCEIPSWT